mgnify:FL=1
MKKNKVEFIGDYCRQRKWKKTVRKNSGLHLLRVLLGAIKNFKLFVNPCSDAVWTRSNYSQTKFWDIQARD